MFNPRAYVNSRPDGFGVLEVAAGADPEIPRRFAPLTRTDLSGTVTGPLAALTLTQTFAPAGRPDDPPVEAVYRFPLPGDAAVTGVRARFGDVEIRTSLKERAAAAADYEGAKRTGRQAALLTRESPDVFTLAVAGLRPGEEVRVVTDYVQLARPERGGWSLRIPLTTAPRYVRGDEADSRHAAGQPLAVLRDPGHRFALDLEVRGADKVTSPTHDLSADGGRVRLRAGEVVPDRDCVLAWRPAAGDRPALSVWVHPDETAGRAYFLALCVPPPRPAAVVPREVVLLVDHSGSMEGPKWAAADWAVERFLAGLTDRDAFALGVFHNTTRWLAPAPRPATAAAVREAVEFLKAYRDAGGTELGVALEQALGLPRTAGTPARHVLVVTDAEVTDAGRLLRLADREVDRADRRRVNVLCIDAAPNAALASELAARGGGVSRFLTSDPAEDDVTTALDEVLGDWAAPAWAGLALEVNRAAAEALGRTVSLRVPGPAAAIDLGDPPAGRPVWVAGRVSMAGDALVFRMTAGAETLAEYTGEPAAGGVPGLKALFGAERVRRLEYLMHSGLAGDELRGELDRLGYDPGAAAGGAAVYAENARRGAEEVVRPFLVREALDAGLPSAETAFVAVRTEAGRPVGETVVVANALPAEWSGRFVGGAGAFGTPGVLCFAAPPMATTMPPRMMAMSAPADTDVVDSMLMDLSVENSVRYASAAVEAPAANATRIPVEPGRHTVGDGAVLFDSARDAGRLPLPAAAGRLTSIALAARDAAVTAAAAGPGLAVLVFVGDPVSPRARVRVADLLGGGRRPLNIRRAAGDVVRLVVEDPDGVWRAGVPALDVTLGWEV